MPGDSNIVETLNPFLALLFSAGALAAVCGEGLYRRNHRQSVWIMAPEKLLSNPAGVYVLATIGGLAGLAAAVAWLPIMQQSGWSPVGLAFAGLAILGWGHFFSAAAIGFAGLLAVGAALAAIPPAWFGATAIGPIIGWILAAGWMLWLAKFWDQQLDESRAWTTTGALIPMARGAAVVFAAALLGQSVLCFWHSGDTPGLISRLIIVVLELGLAAIFWRNARRHRSIATTVGLWLTLWSGFVAAVPLNAEVTLGAALCGAMFVAVLRLDGLRSPPNTQAVHLVMSRFAIPCVIAILYLIYPTKFPFLAMLAVLAGAMHNFKIEGPAERPLNQYPNG